MSRLYWSRGLEGRVVKEGAEKGRAKLLAEVQKILRQIADEYIIKEG